MLRAIIANDKKKTNLMLQEVISWNALGIEICGMADTAEEATRLILDTMPDIVMLHLRLTGLNMPDLIRTAEENGIFPAYIILGGTRSFESVYSALKCRVDEYLIGQVNPIELSKALKKICDRKLNEEKVAENEQRERRIFDMNKNIIRKHFISNWLSGNVGDAMGTMNRLNGMFLFNFRPGIFESIIIKPDFKEEADVKLDDVNRILDEMGAILEEQLGKRCLELVWYGFRGALLCVLNYNGDMHREYEILFERLKKWVKDRMDGFLTMALGTREHDPVGIIVSMSAAKVALERRILLGVDRIIVGVDGSAEGDPSAILTPEHERNIRKCVEALDSQGLVEEWNKLFITITRPEDPDPTLYYTVGLKMGEQVVDALWATGSINESKSTLIEDYYRLLRDCYTAGMLHDTVSRWCVGAIEKVVRDKDARASRSIRVAKIYIREHYMEPIKLSDVAKEVHLNPSYFSTLFKKEVGVNFNDFLIDCRLEAAKNLLRTTTLSISQITETIGYTDTKYFSKLFVKITGVKPSEYRRIYS